MFLDSAGFGGSERPYREKTKELLIDISLSIDHYVFITG